MRFVLTFGELDPCLTPLPVCPAALGLTPPQGGGQIPPVMVAVHIHELIHLRQVLLEAHRGLYERWLGGEKLTQGAVAGSDCFPPEPWDPGPHRPGTSSSWDQLTQPAQLVLPGAPVGAAPEQAGAACRTGSKRHRATAAQRGGQVGAG